MQKRLSLLLFLGSCTLNQGLFPKPATAQVTPDGTTNTTVDVNGNDFTINQGESAGSNLFHSFRDFSVSNGGSAFFDNAADIVNIFSRVTGGNISNIDGLLRANGSANLFLLNPAGIIFGAGARLDLGGSFYGSSADSILFEDGEFSATDLDNPPLLTINAPIGLNFRDNPGDIVNQSVVQNSAGDFVGLEVLSGKNLTLVGGNINFEAGNTTARGGNIELGGLSSAGTVGINDDGSLDFPEDGPQTDITLSNAADVDVRGTGGGNITINARNLNLEAGDLGRSGIRAGIAADSGFNGAQAGDININTTGAVNLSGGSSIQNQVNRGAIGNSGNINVTAQSLTLTEGSSLSANTLGQGNAGLIEMTASDSITFDGENSDDFPSGATSQVNSEAVGDAGGVTIDTGSLTLINGGRVSASTFSQGNAGAVEMTASDSITFDGENSDGTYSGAISQVAPEAVGDAGGVTITTTGSLSLTDGGKVDASTNGQGNAGLIEMTASDTITIDGEDSRGFPSGATSRVSSNAVGNAGGVTIDTGSLTLTNGGRVSASTFGQGDADSVEITASDTITIDGENSRGFTSRVISRVSSNAVGNAGGVTINTGSLTLTNGGKVDASTNGQGNAGLIEMTASDTITIDGEDLGGTTSGAISQVNSEAVGDAGGVTINTGSLTLTKGGLVSASTFGQGNAGSVEITATDTITIDGEDSRGFPSNASSTVEPEAVGDAGKVSITTGSLSLTNGGEVINNTFGQGNAGNLTVTASESIELLGSNGVFPSGLFANAIEGNGKGGNLTIATDKLIVRDEAVVTVGNFQEVVEGGPEPLPPGTGAAGNLEINARSVEVNNKGKITANNANGIGGELTLNADSLTLENEASISASTTAAQGQGGILTLNIDDTLLMRDLSLISGQATEGATGGNIGINAEFIVAFPNQNNDIIANAKRGNGGNIDITAEALFGIEERPLNPLTNDINASSEFGLSGNVTINTLEVDPTKGLVELPTNLVDPSQQIDKACTPGSPQRQSSFVVTGRGGLPLSPTEPLQDASSLTQWVKPKTSSPNPAQIKIELPAQYSDIKPIKTSQGDIYPARGVIKTKDGQIILTPYPTDNIAPRTAQISPNCI